MKKYHLTPWFMLLYSMLSLLYIGILLSILGYAAPDEMKCIGWLIGVLYMGYILYKVCHEHIVISEDGIEFHSPWSIYQTNWRDLEKIVPHWYHGWNVDCLVIDNTHIKKMSVLFERGVPMSFGFLTGMTIIPLSCFAQNWRKSDLGQQIKQHAPHLFAEAN